MELSQKQLEALALGRCKGITRKRPRGLIYKVVKTNKGWFKKRHTLNKGINNPRYGKEPWNKGLKGIHLSTKTEFKKGIKVWNKDKRIWNGTESEYKRIHRWVRRNLGKPVLCQNCGDEEKIVWANRSQNYLRKLDDWISLCRSCHIKKDFSYIKENI